jgi:hypothetical protein
MKAKVNRGAGFRGVLNYILDVGHEATHTKQAERLAGNMSGTDARGLSQEFATVRELRPDIQKPVWHCSLSLPLGDRLSDEQWEAVAQDFMDKMEFNPETTPWVAMRHQDTDKDHIHIVASRVGLDGKVWLGQWEARRAIEATQALELSHGLTLTAGLEQGRSEQKQLSDSEINRAVRTGEEPTRQRLQRLLDEALKDKPAVAELAERLEAAGIGVRANLASTGRMNGFSFELEGVAFKGSDLGKGYTWSGLQKAGVTYDEIRDRERLERFSSAVADRGEREAIATVSKPDAPRLEVTTERDLKRGSTELGATRALETGRDAGDGSLRSSGSDAAQNLGRTHSANERERDALVRAESREARNQPVGIEVEPQQHGTQHGASSDIARQTNQHQQWHDQGSSANDRGGARDTSTVVAKGSELDIGGDRERFVCGDWASRFRQASAAKRRAANRRLGERHLEQGNAERARVVGSYRQSAREINPSSYLESNGYTVKREKKHLSIQLKGEEVYRLTQKESHWLWCDRYGNQGGDNIDLVREIEPEETGYSEAVYRLNGSPRLGKPLVSEICHNPPNISKEDEKSCKDGRQYLEKLGIGQDTIHQAEQTGMVRYEDGGIMFIGYNKSREAQNITRIATSPNDPIQKRDFRGSDKSYPPILRGNPSKVWVVEDGLDSLAIYEIAKRNGQEPPTVIVSGGPDILNFLARDEIKTLLRGAEKVVVMKKTESYINPKGDIQNRSQEQIKRIEHITERQVHLWSLKPEQGKDLVDLNVRQVAQIQRSQEAEKIAKRQEREAGYGHSPLGLGF